MTYINKYYITISDGGSHCNNNKTEKYIIKIYNIFRGINSIGRVTVLHTVC